MQECHACNGRGQIYHGGTYVECPGCKGSGRFHFQYTADVATGYPTDVLKREIEEMMHRKQREAQRSVDAVRYTDFNTTTTTNMKSSDMSDALAYVYGHKSAFDHRAREEHTRRMKELLNYTPYPYGDIDGVKLWDEPKKPKKHVPKTPTQEITGMTNYSTAVMLFNENIRAVRIIYNPQDKDPKQSTYLFKTLDRTIQKDDYVVIPTSTRHGMTVVRVAEVDVEVDYSAGTQVNWIIAKVDATEVENTKQEELKWIELMKKSEARAKREEMKKNMMEFVKDEEVKALAITHMGGKEDNTAAPTE